VSNLKKHSLEIFILNYFYKNPDKPQSYGQIFLKCRKEYPEASTSTIRNHFDALIDKEFIKKLRHDRYRLSYTGRKKEKQYDTEAFLLRIIKAYNLKDNYWRYDPEESKNIFHKSFRQVNDTEGRPVCNLAFLRNKAIDPDRWPWPIDRIMENNKRVADALFTESLDLIAGLHTAKTESELRKRKEEKTEELEKFLNNLPPRSDYYKPLLMVYQYLKR
jgi:hypothetical protein